MTGDFEAIAAPRTAREDLGADGGLSVRDRDSSFGARLDSPEVPRPAHPASQLSPGGDPPYPPMSVRAGLIA
ncbi:MAG: hypothetical protein ACRDOI_06695, partial [Trebonia sp.]